MLMTWIQILESLRRQRHVQHVAEPQWPLSMTRLMYLIPLVDRLRAFVNAFKDAVVLPSLRLMKSLFDRKHEIMRRAGRDPVWADRRPLSEIMNDEIPYERWENERRQK